MKLSIFYIVFVYGLFSVYDLFSFDKDTGSLVPLLQGQKKPVSSLETHSCVFCLGNSSHGHDVELNQEKELIKKSGYKNDFLDEYIRSLMPVENSYDRKNVSDFLTSLGLAGDLYINNNINDFSGFWQLPSKSDKNNTDNNNP